MDSSSKLSLAIEDIRSRLLNLQNEELDDMDEDIRIAKQALRAIYTIAEIDAQAVKQIAIETLKKLDGDEDV